MQQMRNTIRSKANNTLQQLHTTIKYPCQKQDLLCALVAVQQNMTWLNMPHNTQACATRRLILVSAAL